MFIFIGSLKVLDICLKYGEEALDNEEAPEDTDDSSRDSDEVERVDGRPQYKQDHVRRLEFWKETEENQCQKLICLKNE